MGFGLPDLGGVIKATEELPDQFKELVTRLDRVVELLEQTNELLRSQS